MNPELLIYLFLSGISFILGVFYFLYPKKVLPVFFFFGLVIPTSNQFMPYTSFSGVYFYDFFFLILTLYYVLVLINYKAIFKKNLVNILLGLFILIFYSLLAVNNSVSIDKYLFRDLRPFLTLLYAFVIVSVLRERIISFNALMNILIFVFIAKILFFFLMFFGFSFSDRYYQENIFRYFDAVTFIACLLLIYFVIIKENISKLKLNFVLILALIIVLISNLRILIFALALIYFVFSKRNLITKGLFSFVFLSFFLLYSYFMSANRVIDTNSSELVALQIASRFAPAIEKIDQMKSHEYIYGLGLGTYFEIPWFKYRGLDTKLNTIDSTYLSLFVKYGLFSIVIIVLFFRLLLFNIREKEKKRPYIIFYLIVFITLSSLYQSGTVFHFLFLNLLFLSINNESTSRSIPITS